MQPPGVGVLVERLDIDDVAGIEHLVDLGRRPAAGRPLGGLGPLHAVERDVADRALLGERAARIARRVEADARGWSLLSSTTASRHGATSASCLTSASFGPQSPADVDLGYRAAPALGLVEFHKAVHQNLASGHLQLRIERGAHRKAALVERLLAVFFIDPAANLLGEIFGRENVGAGRPRGHRQRLLLGLLAICRLDRAGRDHLLDHPVAALKRALALAERVVVVGRLRQRREIGGLGNRQFVHRLVEIEQRGRGDPVGADAEIDFVEIELEDLVLRIGALDLERQQRFLDLALERHFVAQKEVLRDLLGDGGGALRPPARAIALHVEDAGAEDAAEVEAVVLVEVLVLGRQERVDHHLRHRLDRNVEPALGGVLSHQRPIAGVHAGHHRRFVVLKLRIVRQVLGEMPEHAGDGADAHQEHDGPGRKHEAAEA